MISPVELDLLTEHAGAAAPFPLRVPSFGHTTAERARALADAARALTDRGLADESGPRGVAAALVAALRDGAGTVHLVVVEERAVTAAAALVHRDGALLCTQAIEGGQAGAVAVRRVSDAALPAALAALAPAAPGAPTLPITLPPGVVDSALRLIGQSGDNEVTRALVRDLIRDRSGDPHTLDQLIGLLGTVTARGQLGAAGSRELSWLDCPTGRVRVDVAADGWTSVNPLRPEHLRRAAADAARAARGN